MATMHDAFLVHFDRQIRDWEAISGAATRLGQHDIARRAEERLHGLRQMRAACQREKDRLGQD